MHNYMMSLQKQFCPDEQWEDNYQAIQNLRENLSARLEKAERKDLLKILDLETELQEAIGLANFIAGFKLAWGITTEISMDGPYSFLDDEEQRASKFVGNGGATP